MDFNSLGLFILRVALSSSIAFTHGLPKILDFSNKMNHFPDPLGFGSFVSLSLVVGAEFFCAIAVMLGLFTRAAAIPLVVTMAVAFFVFHAHDPFAKKELAFLYFTGFSAVLCCGAGKFSADNLFRGVK